MITRLKEMYLRWKFRSKNKYWKANGNATPPLTNTDLQESMKDAEIYHHTTSRKWTPESLAVLNRYLKERFK